MFAADQFSSVSNGNAKSHIQALLKNREQHPLSFQRYPLSSKDLYSSSLLGSALAGNTGLSTRTHNSELSTDPQDFSVYRNSECISPDHLENQKDFNYSQKLFHIADGNLYSIFSPIQGRSYGMKPSFLRKQKYTVQECHSRGRKNLRKGLKFHNFLPSESITSEKDGDFLRTKWKVHSECRLKEEHGTKQITISNWSQSVQDSPEDNSTKTESQSASKLSDDITKPSTSYKILENESKFCDNIDPYDFNLCLDSSSECSEISTAQSVIEDLKTRNVSISDSAKKEALNFVLNALIEKPTSLENTTFQLENSEIVKKPLHFNQKHRRKPSQTRRIVPYVKYLSLMEENNCVPLDLSSKCTSLDKSSDYSNENSIGNLSENVTSKDIDYKSLGVFSNKTEVDSPNRLNNDLNLANMSNYTVITNNPTVNNTLPHSTATPPFTFLYPVPLNKNVTQQVYPGINETDLSANFSLGQNHNSDFDSFGRTFKANQPVLNNLQYSVQKSQSRSRRRNQRSLIKQKLEDTFRQNGFLVKTKQVSDGEATFCKFRQLRKYTRYYLKSWQQHLPDEVHKMWKGFLPPKTVLPSVTSNGEPTNEGAT